MDFQHLQNVYFCFQQYSLLRCFVLLNALDKAGAVVGPLIAYAVLHYFGQTKQIFFLLFVIALVPAVLAVIVLALISEKKAIPEKKQNFFKVKTSKEFKHYLYSAGIFSLAYFSFGFLLLKAYIVGFAIADVVLLYALFNFAFVIAAAPLGKLGDKIGRKKIIIAEYVLYALMCLGFIFAVSKLHIILLFIVFGIFYAIDESQSKAYIADIEKKHRATAIGLYNFTTGLIYLPASIIAGLLWKFNPAYAFMFAAGVSVIALLFFMKK